MRLRMMATLLALCAGCAASVVPGAGDDGGDGRARREASAPPRESCARSVTVTVSRVRGDVARCEPGAADECYADGPYAARRPAWACDPAAPDLCTKADRCDAAGCHCGAGPACGARALCVRGDADDPNAPPHCDCI